VGHRAVPTACHSIIVKLKITIGVTGDDREGEFLNQHTFIRQEK
jgi:hypothetical protein